MRSFQPIGLLIRLQLELGTVSYRSGGNVSSKEEAMIPSVEQQPNDPLGKFCPSSMTIFGPWWLAYWYNSTEYLE